MSTTRLLLGIINSQPRGLSQDYYESVYQNYYKPCLTVLNEFPEIPFVLYYSGTLMDWLEMKHPEATMLINEMVKRKQVELLGGGYYEPVFTFIPNSDRSGQIEAQTIQLRKRFGRRPRGGWLGEMIWEPGLPFSLCNSGIEYTFLDDSYFKIAGARSDDLNLPCITEDQGKTVVIFPIDSEIKNYFLENTPEDSFDYLSLRLKSLTKRDSRGKNRVLSVFFSGEDWNGFESGVWLKSFLEIIQKNIKELDLDLPINCPKSGGVLKKFYFPSLLPGKMLQDRKDLPRHDTARNLMTNYPEINLLYSKLLFVNNQIRQIRGDKSRKRSARFGIWKSQQNRTFWYPSGKGDTYRMIRQSAYSDLIQAEMHSRESGIFQPNLMEYDFTMNGITDFMYQGDSLNAYIQKEGARVFELDYLTKPWNYQDTICHWVETNGNRDSFVETFYSEDNHPRRNGDSKGTSFLKSLFEVEEVDKDNNRIVFRIDSRIPDLAGKKRAVTLRKIYQFSKIGFKVSFEIENSSDIPLEFYFSTEINLNFASTEEKLKMEYVSRGVKKSEAGEKGTYRDLKSVEILDVKNKCGISISTSKNCEMIKKTEKIFDENFGPLYQGTKFMLGWKKKAEAHKSWGVEINLGFNKI